MAKEMPIVQQTYEDALASINHLDPWDEEYTQAINNIQKLHEMTVTPKKQSRINPETIVVATVSTLQIVALMMFEHNGHVITSKALGFLTKLRT